MGDGLVGSPVVGRGQTLATMADGAAELFHRMVLQQPRIRVGCERLPGTDKEGVFDPHVAGYAAVDRSPLIYNDLPDLRLHVRNPLIERRIVVTADLFQKLLFVFLLIWLPFPLPVADHHYAQKDRTGQSANNAECCKLAQNCLFHLFILPRFACIRSLLDYKFGPFMVYLGRIHHESPRVVHIHLVPGKIPGGRPSQNFTLGSKSGTVTGTRIPDLGVVFHRYQEASQMRTDKRNGVDTVFLPDYLNTSPFNDSSTPERILV